MQRLPKLIDPVRFAEKGARLTGVVSVSCLEGLGDVLASDEGELEIDFSFINGKPCAIVASIKGQVQLRCQSCLEAVDFACDCRVKLGIVTNPEAADDLPPEYETLLLCGSKIPLNTLIENELLLAFPDFPRHDNCFGAKPANKPINTQKPFGILATLKQTGEP